MLALYRAGRQAEALEVYHEFRGTLLGELGLEPSASLNALQRNVLSQGRALDLVPPAPQAARDAPALERGDHAPAAQRVRDNLTTGLPDFADALER